MLVQVSPLVVLVVLVEVVLAVYPRLTHLQEKVALTERSQQEAAVEAGTTVAKETAQTAGTVLTKLKQGLVEGDVNALNELVSQSLVPAGVALVILVVGYFVASFLGRVIGGSLSKRVDLTFGKFFGRMLKNGVMAMVLLGVLGYFGIDVTSFAAIIAALGFAVGMALQGTLGNFAAGVMLMSHSAKFVCVSTSRSMMLLKLSGMDDSRIEKKPMPFFR